MKYYIIAGEASGDLHGANLIGALQQADPLTEVRCWGGDSMAQRGATLVKHYRDLAFMGFVEVVQNLPTILRNLAFCKKDILAYQPDALILIDYPGFNLRIAQWARKQGLRVVYYISPQIWAWNSRRVHAIKAHVDQMYVILPFEAEFYARYDYPVTFVGHPLLDVIDQYESTGRFRQQYNLSRDQPLIALLPGSRRQEISRMLPTMLAIVPNFPGHQFVVAGAPSIPESFYQSIFQEAGCFPQLLSEQTYELLANADAALVTSGTATLETALFDVPEVVCYRGSTLSYHIARRLVNVRFISLVNLVLDRQLVTELIQNDYRPDRLTTELRALFQPERRQHIQAGYQQLKEKLGHAGASRRVAQHLLNWLNA